MQSSSHVFIYSAELDTYHYPADCPFKTGRTAATRSILRSGGASFYREVAPRFATREELHRFHPETYLQLLERISDGDLRAEDLFYGVGTADTPIFSDLYTYATLATGGSILGAELLLSGDAHYCFNASGGYHHAYAEKAGGFCYINDVVLACKKFQAAGKRVFCLDLDAHHGNGTQAAFYNDPSVMTVSFHESGKTLFPWGGFEDETGEGAGLGYNVNVPLPAGTDDDAFATTFNALVPPLLTAYQPDYIVLEIGMDVLTADPLTHLNMTNNAIADALPYLRDTKIPILMVGGGGYKPDATARGWALAWQVLCDAETDSDLTIGMGGVFLGNAEWSGGLRDMRNYARGDEKRHIDGQLQLTIDQLRKNVFPLHDLPATAL